MSVRFRLGEFTSTNLTLTVSLETATSKAKGKGAWLVGNVDPIGCHIRVTMIRQGESRTHGSLVKIEQVNLQSLACSQKA